jgi:thiol:disulfide interchange protein DsbD
MKFLKLLAVSLILLLNSVGYGQIHEPVKWKFSQKDLGNNEYELIFKATIDSNWHIYPLNGGSSPTVFTFEKNENIELIGEVIEKSKLVSVFDRAHEQHVQYFENEAIFAQKVKASKKTTIVGSLNYMTCDDSRCLPPADVDFEFELGKGAAASTADKVEAKIEATKSSKDDTDYWSVFIIAFIAGLAALLTPCVFPMIPMTVSFFTKQSKTKAKGIRNGIWFGISIVIIYVLLGTVVSTIFGPESLNKLSTEPWFNVTFGVLLLVFAFSFFGAFDIVLPSKWVNAVDKKADKGGIIGIFFMAFALALVSFSCTGPILGAVIVQAATEGGIGPVIGMLGFSLALAIPFAFFAAFPGYLNSLPQSGGWLNSVKVVLAFVEFAMAFKFFSMAEMVLDLHWFERELFIAIWVATTLGLAFYLWGKLRFPHDSPMEYIPVSRFVLGLLVFSFAIYMIPGLWGAPVKLISGFPPPANYAEAPEGVGRRNDNGGGSHANFLKHEKMHIGPHGIALFENDYKTALAYAKKVNKPLVVDFTGKACTNCRKMEDNVWIHPEVKKIFANDVVIVSLYVDLRIKLPKEEQYKSEYNGKKVKTLGQKFTDMQIMKYQRNTQPFYVILDGDEKQLLEGKPYEPNAEVFLEWLKEGVSKYKK